MIYKYTNNNNKNNNNNNTWTKWSDSALTQMIEYTVTQM